jgi:AcrR family transcriptional regulator
LDIPYESGVRTPQTGPPPRRARRSDFERSRRRIVEAARLLMAERGPDGLTVSAVARAAGINRTTAYQHFPTRDELVRAVTAELVAEVAGVIGQPGALTDRIDRVAAYFVDHPEIARLALHLLLTESPFPREAWAPYFDEMRALSESGGARPGVDPEMLAHAMMSVALLWPLHARIGGEDEATVRAATRRFVRELKRLLLYGLFRPEAHPDLVAAVEAAPAPDPRPRRSP